MNKLVVKCDRLLEVYRIAEEKRMSENRSVVLESDIVYAILARPKSVIGITSKKLGLSPELLETGIANHHYPQIPFSANIERLAIEYFSKLPGILEMVLPEHLLFVLSRTSSFTACLEKLGIDPALFVSELYRRSGKNIFDFPIDELVNM